MNPRQIARRSRLVVVSTDEIRIDEFRAVFGPLSIEVLSLADIGLPEPATRGRNALEIATGKAAVIASRSGYPAVGLVGSFEIDPLRRYGGGGPRWHFPHPWPNSSERLISELVQVERALTGGGYCGPDDRGAYFQCVLCLIWPDLESSSFCGTVDGQLAHVPTDAGMVAASTWAGQADAVTRVDDVSFEHFFIPDGRRVIVDRLNRGNRETSHYQQAIQLMRASIVNA